MLIPFVRHVRALAAAAAVVALALLAVAATPPHRAAKAPPKASGPHAKVILIGLDAADWSIMRPAMANGSMPNFARALAHAATGDLLTIQPMTKSPVIWTTIATGKSPRKHGINDFLDGTIPTTSNQWQAKPVWDILGSAGRSVGVFGWWVSWPAQPVNGVLVSDYIGYGRGLTEHGVQDLVYPSSALKSINPMVVSASSITNAELRPFLGADPDSLRLPTEAKNLLEELRWIIAADRSFVAIANAYATGATRPDFFALYLRGIDAAGHMFWNYAYRQDALTPGATTKVLTQLFSTVMPRYYAYTDSLLGPLLRQLDDKTTLVVCSDHGFQGGRGGGVNAHRPEGIVAFAGRGVAPGTLSGATVYDITPTILSMYGLPRAKDMDGVALAEALDPAVYPMVPPTLATYETGTRTASAKKAKAIPSAVDEELKERLKSLGYIQGK